MYFWPLKFIFLLPPPTSLLPLSILTAVRRWGGICLQKGDGCDPRGAQTEQEAAAMGSGEVGAVTGDQWLGSTRHRTVGRCPNLEIPASSLWSMGVKALGPPSNHISSHPPLGHRAPPHWPPCSSHITPSPDGIASAAWKALLPALFSNSSCPQSSGSCSSVVSSERPSLTTLPHGCVPPTTTIPAILIPLTLLCFSSQHLSPPANILFTGWLSASSTEKSTPWGQGLCPLIYPSCLHECHARSTGQVCQTHTQMDERMSGWKEIYTHKQIKIFKSAYK